MYLLWVCDPQDFSAESTNKCYGLVHGGKLGYGNVGGLVHTLPVLNLEEKNTFLVRLRQGNLVMFSHTVLQEQRCIKSDNEHSSVSKRRI